MDIVAAGCVLLFVAGALMLVRGLKKEADAKVRIAAMQVYCAGQLAFPGQLLENIYAANPNRTHENMGRRIQKIGEELGELNQAHLSVTSASNAREMTWADVREEAVDTAIVALDVALTPFPDEDRDQKAIAEDIMTTLRTKLSKWARNRALALATTQTNEDDV